MGPRVPGRMGTLPQERKATLTQDTDIPPEHSATPGGYLYSNHVRDLTTGPNLHHSVLPALLGLLNRVLAFRC